MLFMIYPTRIYNKLHYLQHKNQSFKNVQSNNHLKIYRNRKTSQSTSELPVIKNCSALRQLHNILYITNILTLT